MSTEPSRITDEPERPVGKGKKNNEDSGRQSIVTIETNYQQWYTESYALLKQLLPDRLDEFKQLYMGSGKEGPVTANNFNIQHWLNGMRAAVNPESPKDDGRFFQDIETIGMRMQNQLNILSSVASRFRSSLFDIRQMVQADIFDSELEAAGQLSKMGFVRAAGSVAGVVLEKHLAQVAYNHNVRLKKRNPTISDLNDALKTNETIDTPTWRNIQRLGDIRNLCTHNKDREPTKDEVDELISGVDKYAKTLM